MTEGLQSVSPWLRKPNRLAVTKSLGPWFWALGALGACWLLFFNELRTEWQINAQYNYGYVVPLLGLVLIWRCWPGRPSAVPPAHRAPTGILTAALFLLVFPIRMFLEANPEWRLLYWVNGFQVVGLSLCFLHLMGGWSWVRYFAPPIVFMLIAVPWPMGIEQLGIQSLMRFVAGLTVEVTGWFNIPAVQHGNLIEVGAGIVGIDEACSGVRSLQSALMLSLFLGEMHRFSIPRRLGLVAGSLIFVILANLTRTSFLVWTAANSGMQRMEAWHDTAGLAVMIVVLSGLLLLAYLIKPRSAPVSVVQGEPVAARPIPVWLGVAALVWIALVQLTTELWYRSHESHLVANPRWSVAWPKESAQFKQTTIPEGSLTILRCSESQAASWQDAAGNDWSGFLLRWAPGKNSAQLAKGHRPDICFPAAGARMIEDLGPVTVRAANVELPFQHQSFESRNQILHVFYCLWSDRRSVNEPTLVEDGSRGSRFRAVIAGKRHLGMQVLEIVIAGLDSSEAAVELLKEQLPSLIRPEQGLSVTGRGQEQGRILKESQGPGE